VLLRSSDGARVELRAVGYQFPGRRPSTGERDEDANWLVIRGDVRLADGRAWSFEDPCLLTWEARSLADWLRGVASGAVVPKPPGGDDGAPGVVFVEPNLAVSLVARDDRQATIRVHLSLEAAPPWSAGTDSGEPFESVVEVSASLAEVARAAAEWDRELAAYPVR
jgi:hypothetical protein